MYLNLKQNTEIMNMNISIPLPSFLRKQKKEQFQPRILSQEDREVLLKPVQPAGFKVKVPQWGPASLAEKDRLKIYFRDFIKSEERKDRGTPRIDFKIAGLFRGVDCFNGEFEVSHYCKSTCDLRLGEIISLVKTTETWGPVEALGVAKKALECDALFPGHATVQTVMVIFQKNGAHSSFLLRRNSKKRASITECSSGDVLIHQSTRIFCL